VGRFASTVEFYQRFREPYPPQFFHAVASRLALSGQERLLDVACGPGLLAIGFAPYVSSCTGIDPEPGMIAAAEEAARNSDFKITFVQSRLEDLPGNIGQFEIVTIGRALHWLDRDAALPQLERLVPPGGFLLVCGAPVSEAPINAWLKHYKAVRNSYSSDNDEKRYKIDFQAWFAPSRFRQIDRISVTAKQQVAVSDLVHRALSMSTTSPEALGDRRCDFEAEMLQSLAPFAVDGLITEEIEGQAAIFA
jgi:SAM-dependent methyltransferase